LGGPSAAPRFKADLIFKNHLEYQKKNASNGAGTVSAFPYGYSAVIFAGIFSFSHLLREDTFLWFSCSNCSSAALALYNLKIDN